MRPTSALLLALLALVLGTAAPAQAAPVSRFGVDVANASTESPAQVARDLRDAQRAGARVVRLELVWHRIEPRRGELDPAVLANLDAAFREAARRKLKVLALFLGTPCWAAAVVPADRDCGNQPIRDVRDAVFASTTLARRYQAQIAAFEIWNEPDHSNQQYWDGPNKAARYVELVKALYGPLKAAAPAVSVLAGAFVGQDGRWLKAMYDNGVKGHYDALSVHFYDLTLNALRTTRRVQREHGDATPMWLGETGWSSCTYRGPTQEGHLCQTRTSQARQTADLVRAMRRTPWVHGVVLYTLRDDRPYDFGLYDRSGRLKPVGRTFRSEVRAKRARAARRVSIRLVARRGRAVVTGTAPGGDLLQLVAETRRYRYTATLRLTPGGRVDWALPAALGTRGVRVRLTHPWTGRRGSASR